ncbi:PEP-CTERM sorting domain-containing protein [Limnofasciculus baicalensis]|uniref:PEP-CTERM sorting domain-containing protein n=1 Tax=Limnofasciculus baicalensis BBK-W-15 TaxID=2699891 RepID=A0AAE3GQC6_9CYAN|nr:PEP-CTERM sorting domain-containing protein [Limnofasciculus baicalensis]MCP2727958.1 PEP-CTERM sorting domain-containing protein [Limnofasciculus baicalensis BBK-W-15]
MRLVAIHQLSVATAVGALLSLVVTGEAQSYTFTKIADGSSPLPLGSFDPVDGNSLPLEGFGSPAINNNGTVAFWTVRDMMLVDYPHDRPDLNAYPQQFIMSGNGGLLTTIYDGFYYHYTNNVGWEPDINDEGTVAFKVFANHPRINSFQSGIFAGNGGAITTIYPFDRNYSDGNFSDASIPSDVGYPAINNQGTVVFSSRNLFHNGNFINTIVSTNPKLDYITIPSGNSNPTINDKGTVAFNRSFYDGEDYGSPINPGIVTSSNGQFTTIADNSSIFNYLGKPAINNQGTVAFSASLDTGVSGIFTSSGGKITTIVDSSGPFAEFGNVAIDNRGNLVFGASLDVGGYGLFTGPDPVANKVIASGDMLFGYEVTGFLFRFRREGLNDAGQIAFSTSRGIYRADPDPEPPKSIPEPTSVLGLFTVGVLALVKRRKN